MKTGIDSLDTGAPDITYEGNQGPKSPQEDKRMMQEFQMAQLQEEYEKHVFEMQEQGLEPMSMEQFKDQVMSEGQMSSNQEGIGGMMQDPRTMAMDGGIMDLQKNAPEGEFLAYINPNEAAMLKDAGGSGKLVNGIPSFRPESYSSKGPKKSPFSSGFQGAKKYTTPSSSVKTSSNDTANRSPNEPDKSPFSSGFQGAKNPTFKKSFTGFGDNKNFVENFVPYSSVIKKLGPLAYLPGQKAKAIKNRTDHVRTNYSDEDYKEFETLSDEQKLSTSMMNFLNLDGSYGKKLKEIGSPGLSVSGNMSLVGDKYVKRDPITNKPITDDFGNLTFGYGNPRTGNGAQQILPMTTGMTTGTDTDTEVASGIPYRGDQFLKADNQALAADGGRIGYAGGGITDLRQGYFLGKLVKKATRGLKKIAKSPIGKLALMYGGAKLGGMGLGKFNKAFPDFFSEGKGIKGLDILNKIKNYDGMFSGVRDKLLLNEDGDFDPFKIGIGGLAALTYFKSKKDQDDEPSLDDYMGSASRGPSLNPSGIREYIAANKGRVDPNQYAFLNKDFYAADGGRIGYADGLKVEDEDEDEKGSFRSQALGALYKQLAFGGSAGMPPVTLKAAGIDMQSFGDDESKGMDQGPTMKSQMPIQKPMMDPRMMQMMMAQQGGQGRMMAAMGGRMGYAEGGESEELLDMGGMEKDYRNDGGFVPMGEYERKDDVPARLSKNEFVFTADAVRNAGGGDIDKGAEIMENMMKNLENGGQVSQGSQGLEGAREMFQTQQRLGEVL